MRSSKTSLTDQPPSDTFAAASSWPLIVDSVRCGLQHLPPPLAVGLPAAHNRGGPSHFISSLAEALPIRIGRDGSRENIAHERQWTEAIRATCPEPQKHLRSPGGRGLYRPRNAAGADFGLAPSVRERIFRDRRFGPTDLSAIVGMASFYQQSRRLRNVNWHQLRSSTML